MSKKRLYKIHRALGHTLGALLFLLAISGICITFRHELMPKFYPSLLHITPQSSEASLETLLQSAQNYLGPERRMTNLYTAEDPAEAYMVLYKDPKLYLPGLITINPYTAEVIGEMSLIQNIFAVSLFFHANLFLGKIGEHIVGLSGLLLLFFAISGVIIWWPKAQFGQKFKKALSFYRQHTPQRLHHLLGVVFALPLVISALSGFFIVYDWPHTVGRLLTSQPAMVAEAKKQGECHFSEQLKAMSLVNAEQRKNLISVHMCGPKNANMKATFGLHSRNFLQGYGRLIIDPTGPLLLQTFNSNQDPSSWNIKRLTIYPIHTGEYLGLPGRLLVLVGGFALATLYITGLVLYFARKKQRIHNESGAKTSPV